MRNSYCDMTSKSEKVIKPQRFPGESALDRQHLESLVGEVYRQSKILVNLKRKVYDTCHLPIATDGLETATLTMNSANRLRACQRAMANRIRNEDSRQSTGVCDVVKRMANHKWQWAGHLADSNSKWTKTLIQ